MVNKKIALAFVLFLVLAVVAGISLNEDSTSIGVTSEWDFTLTQNDVNVFTNILVINDTVLDITVDALGTLPSGNYRWRMALCNLSNIDSMQHQFEDNQGGFEFSTPINTNFDTLTNFGMDASWCGSTNGEGFVLFSNGAKNDLPAHFRIILPEGIKKFELFTGDGTEVVVGQSINKIDYSSDWFNISVSLLMNISGDWNSTANDIWVRNDPEKDKFGANVSRTENTHFKYLVESTEEIKQQSNLIYYISRMKSPIFCGFVKCQQEERHLLDFSDVCKERVNESATVDNPGGLLFDPLCTFTKSDNKLEVTFWGEYNATLGYINVDPTITITDVSVSDSTLTNLTAENNFTHFTISDTTSPINSSNVVFYMPFDTNTSTTTTYDYTSNNRDGTVVADAHFDNTGIIGGAFEFDGTGDWIDLNTNFNLNSSDIFTFSYWFKANSVTAGPDHWAMARLDTGFDQILEVGINGNKCRAAYGSIAPGPVNTITSTSTFAIDEWVHCVFTYNSTQGGTLYYNGVVDATDVTAAGEFGDTTEFHIGDRGGFSDATEVFNGTLDELMVLNISLTSSQVLDLYNNKSSRFFTVGSQEFQNNNITNGTFLNVTINSSTNFGSSINVSVGNLSGSTYDFGDEFAFTNNFASDIPIGTPQNFSLKFLFYPGNSSNPYISPTLENDIVIDSFEESYNLTACRNLTTANTVYTVVNDLTSNGTCIFIKANNITLEGQGYNIDFSQGDNGITLTAGVNVFGVNNTLVRNLTINSSDDHADTSLGVWSDSSTPAVLPYNGVWENINITGTNNGFDIEGVNITVRNSKLHSTDDGDLVVFNGTDITFENITSFGDAQITKFQFTDSANIRVENYITFGNNTVYQTFGGENNVNTTIIDSVLNGSIIIGDGETITFRNATYTTETVDSGNLIRQWYADIQLNDSSGVLSNANVNLTNFSAVGPWSIFYEDWESGWENTVTTACDSSSNCSQIGDFNGCDNNAGDYLFCSSSASGDQHEGSRGGQFEDWDGGTETSVNGIWYTFDASTACGGSTCDHISLDVWIKEDGLDSGENCWLTNQNGSGTPTTIYTILYTHQDWANHLMNLTVPMASTNVSVRIMCDMSTAADDLYLDQFNITGYSSGSSYQSQMFYGLTDANGMIATQTLKAYTNVSGTTTFNTFNITGNKTGYGTNSTTTSPTTDNVYVPLFLTAISVNNIVNVSELFNLESIIQRLFHSLTGASGEFQINALQDYLSGIKRAVVGQFNLGHFISRFTKELAPVTGIFNVQSTVERLFSGVREVASSILIDALTDLTALMRYTVNILQNINLSTFVEGLSSLLQNILEVFNISDSSDRTYSTTRITAEQFEIEGVTERISNYIRTALQPFNIQSSVERVFSSIREIVLSMIFGNLDTPQEGLIGWWKIDVDSVDVQDSSGFGTNGTFTGNASYSDFGKFGGSGNFTGTRYYNGTANTGDFGWVNFPSYAPYEFTYQNNFSFSWWMYRTSVTSSSNLMAIFGIGVYSDSVGCGVTSNAAISCGVRNVSNSIIEPQGANGGIGLNQWHHGALTFESGNLSIYVDGVIVDSEKDVNNNFDLTNMELEFSKNSYGGNFQSWNGSIDEFRIYNRSLTPTEITQIYQSTSNQGQFTIETTTGSTRSVTEQFEIDSDVSKVLSFVRQLSSSLNLNSIANRITFMFKSILVQFDIGDGISNWFGSSRGAGEQFDINSIAYRIYGTVRTQVDIFNIDSTVNRIASLNKQISVSMSLLGSVDGISTLLRQLVSEINIFSSAQGTYIDIGAVVQRSVSALFEISSSIENSFELVRQVVDSFIISTLTLTDSVANYLETILQGIKISGVTDGLSSLIKSIFGLFNIGSSIDTTYSTNRISSETLNIDSTADRISFLTRTLVSQINIEAGMDRVSNLFKQIVEEFRISSSAQGTYIDIGAVVQRSVSALFEITSSIENSFERVRNIVGTINIYTVMENRLDSIRQAFQAFNISSLLDKIAGIFRNPFQDIGISSSSDERAGFVSLIGQSFDIDASIERTIYLIRKPVEIFNINAQTSFPGIFEFIEEVQGSMDIDSVVNRVASFYREITESIDFSATKYEPPTPLPPTSGSGLIYLPNVVPYVQLNQTIIFQ